MDDKTEERRAFVDRQRQVNREGFGPPAQQAVQALLGASLPHPWMYVYELTQNARDAGAKRVRWHIDGDAVIFEHDGDEALAEKHVRALCSLGGSTKSLAAVGYMGVGFKAVFARFRVARISGFGWKIRFEVRERKGDHGVTIPEWLDALLPHWDEEGPEPSAGYTTLFRLERPADRDSNLKHDLARLACSEDPTPLAVLALGGLEQVCIQGDQWALSIDDGVVTVHSTEGDAGGIRRWKAFRSRFCPDDAATRRFLEVRQRLREEVDDHGQRVEREVVALLPLEGDGTPKPPSHGRAYATLPTQVPVPFGFHLQADWLVNVDRQNLRDIEGDPWQDAIIRQVPVLVRQLFEWLAGCPEELRRSGYRAVRDIRTDDGPLAGPMLSLREAFAAELAGRPIVPVHGPDSSSFASPEEVARLPIAFLDGFGKRPSWRPDLLFPQKTLDEAILGREATGFASWLDWGRPVRLEDTNWPEGLTTWWDSLSEEKRVEALIALWTAVAVETWHTAPVVPTDAGTWLPAQQIRWLTEAAPSEQERYGRIVRTALAGLLPKPAERIRSDIQALVSTASSRGERWFASWRVKVSLASLIKELCRTCEDQSRLPLVELMGWASQRGFSRQDLVPLVLTDKGARPPEEALLADPLIEGGECRRALFVPLPALVAGYADVAEKREVVSFLERLEVKGGGTLREIQTRTWEVEEVAAKLEIPVDEVQPATYDYTIKDWTFPFDVEFVPPKALQDWLSSEYSAFRGKGRLIAKSIRYTEKTTLGRSPCHWIRCLESIAWVACEDGVRRRPGDVLIAPDPDFEEVPLAVINPGLERLLSNEGVQFGKTLIKSPVFRRLARSGTRAVSDGELAKLLTEALECIEAGTGSRGDLTGALESVRIRGTIPLGRLVQRTGTGTGLRSDLGGWVVALGDLDGNLAPAIRRLGIHVPPTTTGEHALSFLQWAWQAQPQRVEELRRHLAAAYRYVLGDIDADNSMDLAKAWRAARGSAFVFGQRRWHPLGDDLVVEDIQSPVVRRLISTSRIVVAASHLGDSTEQVQRVAQALGLRLMSSDVQVKHGQRMPEPHYGPRVQRLTEVLATLPGRSKLEDINLVESLSLRVDSELFGLGAYIWNGTLLLKGHPRTFGVETAGQLVDYFQLSQQGDAIPWLTAAILSLDSPETFEHYLSILAQSLGLYLPAQEEQGSEGPLGGPTGPAGGANATSNPPPPGGSSPPQPGPGGNVTQETASTSGPTDGDGSNDPGTVPGASRSGANVGQGSGNSLQASSHGQAPPSGGGTGTGAHRGTGSQGGGNTGQQGNEPGSGDVFPSPNGSHRTSNTSTRPSTPYPAGRAADHYRGMIVTCTDGTNGDGQPHVIRDDSAARTAVMNYELCEGRTPQEKGPNQPGYDIASHVPGGGVRCIEVKGVQGRFEGPGASVTLSARQVHDALCAHNAGNEYWLYVVDSTETPCPRVFPFQWSSNPGALRFGFYAETWLDALTAEAGQV